MGWKYEPVKLLLQRLEAYDYKREARQMEDNTRDFTDNRIGMT